MSHLFRPLVGVCLGLLLVIGSLVARVAYADTAPTATAGSASSGSGSATAPADQLPDASNPGQVISAEKAAYNKAGWPLAVLAGLIMIGRSVGFLAKKWAPLAWLGKGRAAVITAAAVTVAVSAFNALALGGTWYAALVASAAAGFAIMKPHAAEPQPAPASA